MFRLLWVFALLSLIFSCSNEPVKYLDAGKPLSGFHEIQLPDATTYAGNFQDGLFAGQGSAAYTNGDEYRGEFVAGDIHGLGIYTTKDGNIYEGTFVKGETVGSGKLTTNEGDTYQGEWADWNVHGLGTYTDNEGLVYEGSFEAGVFKGTGSIVHPDGWRYTGEVDWWQPHGVGKLMSDHGESYDGSFEYGKYHGQGRIKKEGKVYVGEFADGRLHGTGTLTWTEGNKKVSLTGPWERGYYTGEDAEKYVALGIARPDIERLLFDQSSRLHKALAKLPEQTEGSEDIYLITAAPYYKQDVFRKEAIQAATTFAQRLPLTGHLSLVNNPATFSTAPLVTEVNLENSIKHMGSLMNANEDILLIFLTSHGSEASGVNVTLPRIAARDISPTKLRNMLDEAKIKWRVVVVSSCHSGTFVEPLANANTLIITSSAADKQSFGCSDDADLTFFGRAFLADTSNETGTIQALFDSAQQAIAIREKEAGYEPSEPQYSAGSEISTKLDSLWRIQP